MGSILSSVALLNELTAMEPVIRFLRTLFADSDVLLVRPVETWNEAGRKKSRVDYPGTRYCAANPAALKGTLQFLLKRAAKNRLNLFFGACPRVGGHGRFDQAWQIRTVRALWADIDHVSVDEARERTLKAGMPIPSIILNSGNGVHLYWLLESPYLIDDVGDPPPVETEWIKTAEGRNKARKYIVEGGDRLYLAQQRHISRLGPKASHLQDVLAGIANAVGGDHTTDLSRLLRLPGTMNRKDERNGRPPLPAVLVDCQPSCRYALPTFEVLATPSPERARSEEIAALRLPPPRKVSTSNGCKLDELISAATTASAGKRSEADFAVCCFAIRRGVAKEELWNRVSHVGKFKEQGRRYFDVTWENAAYSVRRTMFEKVEQRPRADSPDLPVNGAGKNGNGGEEGSTRGDGGSGGERPTIAIDPKTTPVADTLHQVTNRLLSARNCFSRSEQLVVINNQEISPVLSPPELAGLLNQRVEFFFVDEKAGEYRPFPPSYANTWLNNYVERSRLPAIKLFTRNPVYTLDWRLVAPGYDAASGIYYAGPPVEVRAGTEHLDLLLRDFCFKTPADRTNYLGMLLTAVLIPRFIGSKPAALFSGNQPELGKSILAQGIAILRDGQPAETASYNTNDEELEKRLGAIVRRGATTIIIDNAKSRGRNPRIESACLERSITDPILSFRLLGQSASIRAENSHIFCITANSPDVSRDLVTRSVVINLYHEGDPERREFSIADPEGYMYEHRLEILGELLGMVERWKAAGMPMAKTHSRFNKRGWGNIVGGILDACGKPDFLANAEEASASLDETRRDFAELVGILVEHPQGKWSPSELAALCGTHRLLTTELGEGSPRALATKMGTLAGRFIAEPFPLADGREAVFHRTTDRKGNVYAVYVNEVPNLDPFAEPMPNLGEQQVRHT